MKSILSLCAALILVAFLASGAFAQEMKPLIAADATLLQTQAQIQTLQALQAGLAKAIDDNSTYRVRRTKDSISKVTFNGCEISFRNERETDIGSYASSLPGAGNASPAFSISVTTLAFDLKQMNLNGVTLTPLVANTNMQMLTITSLPGQQSVSYATQYSNPRFNRSGSQFAATMAIKNDVAAQVKENLVKAMMLCQK